MKAFYIFLLAILASTTCLGQKTISASAQDKVVLTADSFRGEIQWQTSTDKIVWSDVTNGTASPIEITIPSVPIYYRAKIQEANCDPHFSEIITVQAQTVNVKLWSDALTWGGTKPQTGDAVMIPAGTTVILDENPPALGSLTINGTLEFKRQDLSLTSKWILVHGSFIIGTETQPFTNKAIITLTGDNVNESVMGMGNPRHHGDGWST